MSARLVGVDVVACCALVTTTTTTTTLTEDVPNHCQSSGPMGVSDGVLTWRKKHRKSGRVASTTVRKVKIT